MTDFIAAPFVAQLLRTTLMLAAAAAAVGVLLRVARVSSPAVHRAGCVLVLVIGWSFLRVPLVVPWYQPAAHEVVESCAVAAGRVSRSQGPGTGRVGRRGLCRIVRWMARGQHCRGAAHDGRFAAGDIPAGYRAAGARIV